MSKSFIFLVKSFLGNFYRHLAIFFWSHWYYWEIQILNIWHPTHAKLVYIFRTVKNFFICYSLLTCASLYYLYFKCKQEASCFMWVKAGLFCEQKASCLMSLVWYRSPTLTSTVFAHSRPRTLETCIGKHGYLFIERKTQQTKQGKIQFVVNIVMFVWKDENKRKEAGDGSLKIVCSLLVVKIL